MYKQYIPPKTRKKIFLSYLQKRMEAKILETLTQFSTVLEEHLCNDVA